MNRIKVLLLLAVMITGEQYFSVFGQTPAPTPFSCSELGQIVLVGNGATAASSAKTIFVRVNTDVNPTTADSLFTIPYAVNGTGYNPLDGCLYSLPIAAYTRAGVNYPGIGTISSTRTLLRIDKKGVVTAFTVTESGTLPSGNGYKGGAVDANGIFYLVAQSEDNALYSIDLSPLESYTTPPTLSTTRIPLKIQGNGQYTDMPDIVYNPLDTYIYGIENSTDAGNGSGNQTGKVVRINLQNDSLTRYGTNVTNNTTVGYAYGATYITYDANANAHLIAWNNLTGDFDSFDLNTYVKTTDVSKGTAIGPLIKNYNTNTWPAVTGNDGASCPALNADIAVSKNDTLIAVAPGKKTTYSVIVSNTGPFIASNVHVTDSLPAGIPVDSMIWQVTALKGGATSKHPVGVNQPAGALSDTVNIPVDGSVNYKVTIAVPLNYPYTALVNTASAIPDNFVIDLDLSNNSDYDSDMVNPPILPVNPNVRVKIHK